MERHDSKCRWWKKHEIIDHLHSGCSILVKTESLVTHDEADEHLRYSIYKALRMETTEKWEELIATKIPTWRRNSVVE